MLSEAARNVRLWAKTDPGGTLPWSGHESLPSHRNSLVPRIRARGSAAVWPHVPFRAMPSAFPLLP
jgi:hypothetical protein